MRAGIGYLCFTDRGMELAETVRNQLGGEISRAGSGVTLSGWTESAFRAKRALVYVGAVGIAVRAVAPHIQGKARDPAVVCVDEAGRFAVPLLSGHLGGANELARAISGVTGGTAVITTATDLRGVFAVDEWARMQDCAVVNPERIKVVSGKLLAGETVRVSSAFPVAGEPPEGVEFVGRNGEPDVILDIFGSTGSMGSSGSTVSTGSRANAGNAGKAALRIVPRALILGVGCRRGTKAKTLEVRFQTLCHEAGLYLKTAGLYPEAAGLYPKEAGMYPEAAGLYPKEAGLYPEAFRAAATIDRKTDEPGLAAFCAAHGWTLCSFTAEELRRVPGEFADAPFVAETVGVGNVCERAAVLAAGDSTYPAAGYGGTLSPGTLIVRKFAGDGVTMAAALCPVRLDWTWRTDAGNCAVYSPKLFA